MLSKRIGPYEIVDGPFQGGFGEVYRVFDRDSGDEFALKTLKDAFLATSRRVERFRREIELWMRIPVHPNVVRAIRAFDSGERPYVLIEWIGGGNLAERIGELKDKDPAMRALRGAAASLEVLRQICAGMGHINGQGLVHSDLKPSNIMMWAGRSPQITDFGFARMVDEAEGGLMGGTGRYMAPEVHGHAPTVASDIYAAGVMFLDVLEPFFETEFGVREGRELARLMCSSNPVDRPATFLDAEQRLAAILEQAPIPPGIPQRAGNRKTWDETHVAPVLRHRDEFNSAMSGLAAGRRREAQSKLAAIIEEKPDMVDARIALANLLIEDGDRDQAIEHLRAARTAAPESQVMKLNLAGLLATVGLDEEAGEILAGIEDDPGLGWQIWDLRARMAERRGDLTVAIELFERSLNEGGNARVRLALANALRDSGLIDEAIREYHQVGKSDRELGLKVALRLARLYVDTGRFDEALEELRQALKRDLGRETEGYVYGELGFVYKSLELYEAARASYRKALDLTPGSREALEGLRIVEERLEPQ